MQCDTESVLHIFYLNGQVVVFQSVNSKVRTTHSFQTVINDNAFQLMPEAQDFSCFSSRNLNKLIWILKSGGERVISKVIETSPSKFRQTEQQFQKW